MKKSDMLCGNELLVVFQTGPKGWLYFNQPSGLHEPGPGPLSGPGLMAGRARAGLGHGPGPSICTLRSNTVLSWLAINLPTLPLCECACFVEIRPLAGPSRLGGWAGLSRAGLTALV